MACQTLTRLRVGLSALELATVHAANWALHVAICLECLPLHELGIEQNELASQTGPNAAQNFQSFGGLHAANDAYQGR